MTLVSGVNTGQSALVRTRLVRGLDDLRAWPWSLALMWRNWLTIKTPLDAVKRALIVMSDRGDLLWGELLLLRTRARMKRGRERDSVWAVVEAAITDLLIRETTIELQGPQSSEDHAAAERTLASLIHERSEIGGGPAFDGAVASLVNRICPGHV